MLDHGRGPTRGRGPLDHGRGPTRGRGGRCAPPCAPPARKRAPSVSGASKICRRTWSRSRWIVFLRRSAMCFAAAGACCGRTRLARENVSSGRGAIASARHSGGNCDSETLRPVPSMRSRSSQHSEEYTVPTYSCLRILSSFMLRSFLICPAGDHGWASVRASVKNGLRWRQVQAWYSSMVRQNRMLCEIESIASHIKASLPGVGDCRCRRRWAGYTLAPWQHSPSCSRAAPRRRPTSPPPPRHTPAPRPRFL